MKLENIVAVPPDGGWGWVIVAVCFYAYAVIDIPSIGFQVVLPDLMDILGVPASTASVIFSTYTLMLYFMGPFAGGVCNRFGFRTTTVMGCVLMMVGLTLSFFVGDLISYIITFGIIAGAGSSLVFMVGCVAPGYWFEDKRAIALGVASAATGVAVFSVALTAQIKYALGWRWCFVFWAVCIAILCGLAFLLKPPPMVELESTKSVAHMAQQKHVTALDVIKARIKALRPIRTKVTTDHELAEEKLRTVSSAFGIPLKKSRAAPARYLDHDEPIGCGKLFQCSLCCRCCQQEVGARPLYRRDIFYQGNVDYAADIEEMPREAYAFSVSKLPTVTDVKQEVECHCKVPEAVLRAVKEMVDFSLFKSGVFLLLVASALFTYTAIYIPFLLIKKVNIDNMEEKYASMLTLVMGLGSTAGRSSIGFLLYFFPQIRALQVLIVSSMMGGVVVCSMPLDHSIPYQMMMAFLAGALPAIITPLRSVVIIEFLGLKKLTSTTGILFFVQGIGCFVGMPIAELLNELSDSQYVGLVFSGVCYILSGISFTGIAVVSMISTSDN